MSPGTDKRQRAAWQLRHLVASGRYAEAREALEEYCQALAAVLAGLRPTDPHAAALRHEWQCLLRETQRRVLTGRAHAALRLARLARSGRYGDRPAARRTWQYLA